MMRFRFFLGLLAMLAGIGPGWGAEPAPTGLAKELEPLRPLLKTWKGQFINDKGPSPGSDVVRFERALNGRAIRALHSVNEGAYAGETIILWNAAAKQIQTFYFTTEGDRIEGTMAVEKDGAFTTMEKVVGAEGENAVTQVRATSRLLPDGRLHVKSEYMKKGAWVAGHEIMYSAAPGAEVVFK